MTHRLYRSLVWLHPPVFRRQFGAEMLWIFEECADSGGSQSALFLDGFVSLGRQWVVRTGWWKIALALALGLAEITLGGLGIMLFGRRPLALAADPPITSLPDFSSSYGIAHQPLTVGLVVYLAVFVVGGLAVLILGLGFWVKGIASRRRPVLLRVR